MNITFLVGNGFDISAGIDTSYKNFYQWYLNIPSDNGIIEQFKDEIKNDLSNGGQNWSDFEIGLGKFTSHSMLKSAEDFNTCYDDAYEKMIVFLKEMQSLISAESISEEDLKRFRNGIYKYYQDMQSIPKDHFTKMMERRKNENIIAKFISFNYTDTLDIFVESASTDSITWKYSGLTYGFNINPQVLHVHGTTDVFPILGVSDESQIENKDFLNSSFFKEMMIKSQAVLSAQEYWYRDAEQTIDQSDLICIWGMSLGASDKKWWEKVAMWLKASSHRELIIYWYAKSAPNRINPRKWAESVDFVKSLFLKHANLKNDEIASISERMHVVFNTNSVLKVPVVVDRKLALNHIIKENMEKMLSSI